ncbi:MAG: hypothetical protein KatS3mg103_0301 [Phycisphaerales bacterium]|nr:MAG: hypothetical protein KatS3mg103_0301 [Phycisphaerales bacterium]
MRAQVRKAFTLVEILIVVVILGILAAIVIPQFTNASEEAQTSSAASQLSTVRNQIELFRVRNNGQAPALDDLFTENGIVSDDYLRSAPRNPRNRSDTVGPGTEAPTGWVAGGFGWIYDEGTGNIWMNGFDEENNTWYPES